MAQLTGSMIAFPGGATSNVWSMTSPISPVNPGTRARDGAGNEYIFVDYTAPVYGGVVVAISNDGNYTAAPFVNGAKGAIGVVCGQGTSDQGGWVQIYGYCAAAQLASGDSAITSAMFAIAASSVSSPATGLDFTASGGATSVSVHRLFGIWIVGDASTLTTSGTSCTGVTAPVFLNYPYSLGFATDLSST